MGSATLEGTITEHNLRRGMFSVRIDDSGDFTVFELLDGEVRVGSRVRGKLDSSLCKQLLDLETGERLNVLVQADGCTRESAKRLVR